MEKEWGETVLHDTRDNLESVQAKFRVLRDCLMRDVSMHGDVPYLEAREAMYEHTVLGAMNEIEDIMANITEALGDGRPTACAKEREGLNRIFAVA